MILTADDMLYECEVGFDSITNFSAPGYSKKEWSVFLTEAEEELIKQRLNPKGNKYQESFEETEKRAIDFAELINKGSGVEIPLLTAFTFTNGHLWELPLDFFYSINERVDVSYSDCLGITRTLLDIPVKPISHDYYNSNIKNPFKKPYVANGDGLVWRIKSNRSGTGDVNLDTNLYNYSTSGNGYIPSISQKHELITDGTFTVTNYKIKYLRQPKPIIIADSTASPTDMFRGYLMNRTSNVNCELSPSFHSEIVSEAIKKAAAAIKDTEKYQIENVESQKSE